MKGFKILAIRPLEGCNLDYLKILEPDTFYTFYNNYSFYINDETDSIRIEYTPINEELYKIHGKTQDISVNVSAIVGKNGSGKSSLLELYYLFVYFIAINRKKPLLKPNLLSIAKDLEKLNQEEPQKSSEIQHLENQQKEIEKIIDSFKVQLFYSVNETIYVYDSSKKMVDDLEYDFVELIEGGKQEKRKFRLSTLFEDDSPYDPIGFAYSCVINYSIFGLNSIELGNWITTLFHKNDAYRAPIVINPMRTNGDFVIDEENELLSGRLLQSLAICLKNNQIDKIGTLLGTQRLPKKVVFKLKKHVSIGGLTLKMDGSKELLFSDKSIYEKGEIDFLQFKKDLNSILIVDINEMTENNLLFRYCLEYAYSKAGRIYKKYPTFRGDKKGIDFIELLIKDRSHISLKFRQTINFITGELFLTLKQSYFKDRRTNIDQIELNESDYEIRVEYNLMQIKTEFAKTDDELSFAPPPIFEIDFQFSDNPSDRVNLLSSGESQSTHSLNTVYYHLRNVDSMNREELGFDYEYVNIILDEVELYHHPEMQRTYLDRLLKGMEALNLRKIKGINIIFSTHSPFILSDIPKHNILRLEEGMPSEKKFSQTFGANIHELLANHFFLDNGFMGEFAKDYIMKLIKKVDDLKEPINKKEFNDFKTQIEIINEKFIKHKLLEKLESKYEGRFSDIDFLISKKQDELDQLKKRKNDQN